MSVILPVPSQFNEFEITDFLNGLFSYVDEPSISIDFSTADFVYPYGTLLSAIGIKQFVREREKRGLNTEGKISRASADDYLRFFGYFKYIGIDTGNDPGFEPSTNRYLPLTVLEKKALMALDKKIQPAVERKSYSLAKVIYAGLDNESKARSLAYCFREIIRNVFEHAKTDECIIMAQRWNNGFAEIAIADCGIGILESLRSSHDTNDPCDAIELALKPGISSVPESKSADVWANSGYGLFILSELGKKFGAFSIASSNKLLSLNNHRRWMDFPCNATAVKLRLNLSAIEDFDREIDTIIEQGQALAGVDEKAIKRASAMSRVSPF